MESLAHKELISAERLQKRIAELAREISGDLKGIDLLTVVCVLKGAFIFTADLVRHLSLPCRIEFIRASSYGDRRTSSGQVKLEHHETIEFEGQHVLLVEDILDTGRTLSRIVTELEQQHPASMHVCTLLDKPSHRIVPFEAHYTGFMIPDHFVVGYGLDADEQYRELPFISVEN
ncbi:MAG TPA: hypoxanthine phosphoribosyltransferase [Chlorobaculum parvum]|uniref:Hypoxanthine phosphoribosyltransferase n=1 Tax=Chlorobaculum parvum TaxID=274539 RepID=A0A7C5DIH2_9CHLB|nr:hypoxanthine phosphoribosyltransferase [Chlorobaculum parvum]